MRSSHLDLQCSPNTRTRDSLTKLPTPNLRNPLLICWSRLPRGSKTTIDYCCCSWVIPPSRQKGTLLLLKIPCTSDTGPRGPELNPA